MTITDQSPLEARFTEAFTLNEGHTLNGQNARLHALRQAGIERFQALGFPQPKEELWKYTNIRKVLKRADFQVQLAASDAGVELSDLDPYTIPGLDAARVVLVNGHYSERLSDITGLPEGVIVTSLRHAAEAHADLFNPHFGEYASADAPFVALNTAFALDGLFVYVPKNVIVETPIHLMTVLDAASPLFVQPRHLVVVEQGGQVNIVETNAALTDTTAFTNAVTEAYVGPNGRASHYILQDEGEAAHQVNTIQSYQSRDSYYGTHTVTLSGGTLRNDYGYLPNAQNCETHLLGFFLATGQMHVDNHTFMDHAMPDCFSNELYKGILDDQATGVFNGKVMVRQDAQRINAYQSNKSVVLSETARMYSKPELEIYADDVQCSHGATTGQLDDEALFYLRSRGLREADARRMMLLAFARDVLDGVALEPLRAWLDEKVSERLH